PKIKVQPPPRPVVRHVTHTPPPTPMPPAKVTPTTPVQAPVGPPVPDHLAGSTPLNHVELHYPDEAQDEGREGHVTLVCDVEPTGTTDNCTVTSVKGGQDFAAAALQYVRKSRYQPATANGVPVKEFHHTYTITFSLSDN
ncbi:MAG: energy transducer TonB, partial [Acetobacter sp.]|uniref:energy transducer TonB n=1 Tax=Acetobacter sp. TaxID=440 RepID=UPI0039E7EB77